MGLHIVRTGGCNMNRFKKLASYAAIAVLALSGQEALSQGVTGKTVRIVVPFPAGGPADVLARLLAEQIGRAQGRTTMVIEDRPGAELSDRNRGRIARHAGREHAPFRG